MRLICRIPERTGGSLTSGRVYTAMFGIEPGIFATRPFVTVTDDNGTVVSCHLSRFEVIDDEAESRVAECAGA